MNKRALDLGLQSMVVNAPAAVAHTSIETDSFSLDPIFIGREDDVPKLVHMLTEVQDDRIFSTVALVGMGGMGKTTLTRKVFNHESLKARFGSLIWVHVSQTFDPISLFKTILSALASDIGDGVESRELILKRLQEVLKSKTYLLVLDDLWNEDISNWEDFINSIMGVTSTKGNGIIISTRSQKVASVVNSFHIHHLNGLSDEDCWSIIKAKTFDENGEVPSEFEMIGRKIAKKCQGLPLATNVVGGVLRGKSEEEWRFINENWVSHGEGGDNISKILKMSFDHLSSPSLKKCFLFCSIFPKGWEIEKHDLIELWMAEGFLQPSRINDMESVGNMFFNVLIQNSLLQAAYKYEYGNVTKCVMHDLVHDLAYSVLSNNEDDGTPVRYMFLNEDSSPLPKKVAKHLRTLFLRGETSGTKFSDFECLHNLTLSGEGNKELPNSIRGLVHLRNLNISDSNIVKLPKWISELHHLQTLRACWYTELPSTLRYMFNLRHLHIHSRSKLPAEIGRLTNLQTLPHFTVGKEKGYQIEELRSLKNLKGTLAIRNLEMVRDKEEAMKANMFQRPNLFDLVFEWSDDREDERNDESVLEGLQPHANLKKLNISRFKGERFPTWAEKMAVSDGPQGSWIPLANLIKFTLSNCSEIDEIPALEHLPNLKSLSLKKLKKVRLINASFNHLTSLEITELEALEFLPEWLFYNNHNLSYLNISRCCVLRELPEGLDTLNSLQSLSIWGCENLKSIGNPSCGARQSQGILRSLSIGRCVELMELPCEMLESWAPTIEELQLVELRRLKNLPMLIDCLAKSSTRLTLLSILGVPKLKAASIGSVVSWDLSSLYFLSIDVSVEWSREDSVGIAKIVDEMLQRCCNSLKVIYFQGVENWEWLPQSIQNLTVLFSLELENIGVDELPQWLGNLSSLKYLSLNSCNKLKCLPYVDAMNHHTKLEKLNIRDCQELHIDSEWRNHHPRIEIKVNNRPVYFVIHMFTIQTLIFGKKKKNQKTIFSHTAYLFCKTMDGGSAAIEVLLQNLINAIKEEYSLIRDLNEDAQQLQKTLALILAFLSDAKKKFIAEDAVKVWLRELEALAFDADNVLDELSYHRLHKEVKRMMATKAKDKVLSFFTSFNGISRRLNMAHTIKQINATFECMNKKALDLGLKDIIRNAPVAVANTSTETDSLSLDQIFVGRDDDVPKLVHMLTHTHPQEVSIVALVGMGGMGKTTLARKVFKHGSVKARFGSLIWVHVSQTFDPISLFKKVLSALSSDIGGVEKREDIVNRLREDLKNKTYLLVLDDVWNEDILKWDDFINSIRGATSTKGNGIIITTRSEKVASTVGPIHVHHLNGLSDEDCWSIIKAKTSVGNGALEMIGRKIAKRCQGLPLAANVVGGVLRGKFEEDWRIINEKWLSDAEGGDNISKILKLSYDHLSSPSLKKCFTFCSVFPKGQKIVKEELIELWMGEGFLQPSQRDDMESVGNMFFNVLLQNSLLQVVNKDDYGNVSECVMHDLVHDVASSDLSNNADDNTPARYMFLKKESSPMQKNVAKHLRTLFLEGGTSCTKFSGFECLHNLTLSGDYKEIPDSVRGLVHLRNLNISNTKIVKLPKWIGELHLLQTLRVNIWRLEKLPSTLKYMFNLRHLHIYSDTKFPAEIGKLTSLQTLPYFRVGKEKGYQIEELGSLENLKGMLKISNLEEVCDKEDALKANIAQKPNLFHLAFRWSDDREDERNDESVLEGLQPHKNLKKLKISRFRGKRFPAWTEKMAVRDGPHGSWVPLANVIEIKLSECSEIEEIPRLEHLPNLKSLSLKGLKKVRLINTSFNHLTSLKIEELDMLEYLPERLFYNNQNLSCLEICICGVLKELPDGLDTLNSLEILRIWYCENLKSIGNPSGGVRQSQGILRELSIAECGELIELPCQMLESWAPTVEDLELEALGSLENLPMLIDCLAKSSTRLTRLKIKDVPKLMAASNDSVESWDLSSLKTLDIDVSVEWSSEASAGIAVTVEGMLQGCCNSLTDLQLKGVANWEWLPQSIQNLAFLYSLTLKNIGVEELPQWLGNLSSLRDVFLCSCIKLKRLPSVDALKHLTKFERLYIADCPELRIDSEWRSHHPNLEIKDDLQFVQISGLL
ncbi:uncharacterized protein LOC125210529 [Salvia hispanica]|uniref:uncharacterized protein LOC125210529 n=1 Tax=Salvia hispanica TaxID=49212 RepID=UPI00200979C7|nr:uncharacterized protein LOC125210529 [Salvia hispanica]